MTKFSPSTGHTGRGKSISGCRSVCCSGVEPVDIDVSTEWCEGVLAVDAPCHEGEECPCEAECEASE